MIRTLACLLLLLAVPAPARADAVDYGAYALLLERHVRRDLVDYQGLARDLPVLESHLAAMSRVDPGALSGPEAKAFYINLYNAWTLRLVLTEYPDLEGIKDLGSWLTTPWEKPLVRLGAETLTLDQVEHGILRMRWPDARIHFAVNCASRGCPPLRAEPYLGERLDAQLDEATASVLDDSARTRLEGDVLWVNRIFKWYGEDFPNGPAAFVRGHSRGPLAGRLEELGSRVRVRFLDYDWSLNDLNRKERSDSVAGHRGQELLHGVGLVGVVGQLEHVAAGRAAQAHGQAGAVQPQGSLALLAVQARRGLGMGDESGACVPHDRSHIPLVGQETSPRGPLGTMMAVMPGICPCQILADW